MPVVEQKENESRARPTGIQSKRDFVNVGIDNRSRARERSRMSNETTESPEPSSAIAPVPISEGTVLDQFIAAALTGLLAAQTASPTASPNFAAVAKLAVGYAKATMAVRNPPVPPASSTPPPAGGA